MFKLLAIHVLRIFSFFVNPLRKSLFVGRNIFKYFENRVLKTIGLKPVNEFIFTPKLLKYLPLSLLYILYISFSLN